MSIGPPSSSGAPACEALGCTRAWAHLIPDRWIGPSLHDAVFGHDHPGLGYAVCQRHYRLLRKADGIVLGYRYRQGRLSAYVKAELF